MNQHLYRIVFNPARGLLMAVAEIASARGKGASPAAGLGVARHVALQVRFAKLNLLALATQLACGASLLLMPLAHAQIIPDAAAPGNQRPSVINAPNGVPLVNIQTPSASGISRNTYSQFDVQKPGVVLNNANTITNTQLGGFVAGNPNLIGGTARVIVNEVNSSNPSILRGYIEVGGARAQVVVANPSGITCDGCGFINADRSTLTTGTPIFNGDNLEGYRVQRGAVVIDGLGLDSSQSSFTDIIARAVQINAGLFAQDLKITTGANQVSADHSQITPIAGIGAAPAFAIDVAALGGMYAHKIQLIGTEAGVGVRNAGTLGASVGEFTLNVNGRLENSGQITATDQIRIDTQDSITNSGTLAAQGNVALNAAGQIDNRDGTIGSVQANVTLVGTGLLDNTHGRIVAAQNIALAGFGLNNSDGAISGQNVSLDSQGQLFDNTRGRIVAAQNIALAGFGLNNRDGAISGQNVRLDSQGQLLDNTRGQLVTGGALDIQSGALNNDAGLIQANAAITLNTHGQTLTNTNAGLSGGILSQSTLTLDTGALNNDAGVIGALGNLGINASSISNTQGGTISSEQAINVSGTGLDNRGGQIQALGALTVALGNGALDNTSGLLRSGSTLNLSAAQISNANTQGANLGLEGQSVQIAADTLDNRKGAIRADSTLTITSRGSIDNTQGLISGNTVSLTDAQASKTLTITNTQGTLIAGSNLSLDSASLTGDGQVLSLGDLSAKLDADFNNTGTVQANGNARVETRGTLSNRSTLLAGNALVLKAATLANEANGKIRARNLSLTATAPNTFINRGLIDGQDVFIQTITLDNFGTGRIFGDHVAIGATTINNKKELGSNAAPVIAARDRLDLGATTINNEEGALLFSLGDLAIGGSLDSNHRATGQADTLNNNGAIIEALGNADISAKTINNTNTNFTTQVVQVANDAITELQLSGSPNRYTEPTQAYEDNGAVDGLLQAITPEGTRDDYLRFSYNRMTTETQVATSTPGQILAGGTLNITADTLLNDNSRILAGGALTANIGSLTNIQATGARTTTDIGTVTNFYRDRQKGRDDQGVSTAAYAPPATIQSISVGPAVFQGNTAPTGSGTQVAPLTITSVAQTPAGATAAAVNVQSISVQSISVNTTLPSNSLFSVNVSPSGPVISTDGQFTNLRQFLSSDYLITQLSLDPSASQRRLGDGFYEQRLVREQVAELTGRRFLIGYAADEEQYRALLNNGATFASLFNVRLGVALNTEQMAQLTSDIVWLVTKTITLADGQTTQALVPQVYVRVKDGDLNGSGSLIAGQSLNLNISGDLINSGTLAGRSIANLTAENIKNLGGRITATDVNLSARTDLSNLGGVIDAANSLSINASRDINIASTTRDTASSQGKRTSIDRVAGLYITGSGGTLTASAGRDLNLDAATIANGLIESNPTAAGNTTLVAGRNLNLNTVLTTSEQAIVWDGANTRHDTSRIDVGSTIQGKDNIEIAAGNNVSARAANINSAAGALQIAAGNNIAISNGESTQSLDEAHVRKSKGFLSSKTTTTRDQVSQTTALASSLSAERISLAAGADIGIKGSNVVATNDVNLNAQNNVTLDAAITSTQESHLKVEKKSGLFTSGGIGVTLGTQQLSVDQQATSETAAASTVGSNQGNVNINAGQNFKQVGSSIIAPVGDINVSAQKVDIREAQARAQSTTETKFKQSGLTLALTSPIISAIQTAQQQLQAAGQTQDGRLQALALANTALAGRNAVNAIEAGQGTTIGGKDNQIVTSTDAKGNVTGNRDANAADQVGGINLAISIGASQSKSKTVQNSSTAQGSTLTAGRDINISATGAGKDSDLTIQGSKVTAGRDIALQADSDIKLLAAQSTADQKSTNSSSSASVGISIGTSGFGVTVSASGARGKADGNDVTQTNTQVVAGNKVDLQSNQDLLLKGAVISAEQVTARVARNLNIESLQDTSKFASKQQSLGGSVTLGAGAGGSFSASKSAINSDFASVAQQSGIRAGDDGFDVEVTGNTDLKGGAITSTQTAIDQKKNNFKSAKLTTGDIQNKASFNAKAIGVSAGTSANNLGGALKPSGTSIGIGQDSGNAGSTTQAAISGIAGNKEARTGDKETGIQKIFDAEKVQKEINAQVLITQTFGREAPRAAADFAVSRGKDLLEQAKSADKSGDTKTAEALRAEAQQWGEGGAYRIALQAAVGGLGGGVSGALGAGATAAAVPLLNQLQSSIVSTLKNAGASDTVAQLAGQAVSLTTAAGIGAAAGGGNVAGVAGGLNVDANNRQLHEVETKRIQQLAGNDKVKKARLQAAACALAHCADGVPKDDPTYAFLKSLQNIGAGFKDEQALLNQQTGQIGRGLNQPLFQYSFADEFLIDPATQNKVGTRLAGLGQATGGILGAAGSIEACATGIGCTVGAGTFVVSADFALAGAKQAVSGNAQITAGEQVLQGLGLSPATAALTYAALGLAPAGVEAFIANKAVNQSIALNAAAKETYTGAVFNPKGVNFDPALINSNPAVKGIYEDYLVTFKDNARLAEDFTKQAVQSGTTLPTIRQVGQNEEVIRLVPVGDAVGKGSFYISRAQYDAFTRRGLNAVEIAESLGLPAANFANGGYKGLQAFSITPQVGKQAVVYESKVAPIEQGAFSAKGGETQYIVPNLGNFTTPVPIPGGVIPAFKARP